MTRTDQFYDGELYAEELDFSEVPIDDLPPNRGTRSVSYAKVAMGVVATALTFSLAGIPMGFAEPHPVRAAQYAQAEAATGDAFAVHRMKANLARSIFREVPPDLSDELPDPDYGF